MVQCRRGCLWGIWRSYFYKSINLAITFYLVTLLLRNLGAAAGAALAVVGGPPPPHQQLRPRQVQGVTRSRVGLLRVHAPADI